MTSKKFHVEFSQRADDMLLQHTEFLSRVSISAARQLIKSTKKMKSELKNNPEMYTFADEIDLPGIHIKIECFSTFCSDVMLPTYR